MTIRLKKGWTTAQRHPWLITMLFMYRLTWGYVLYTFIKSMLVPLLHRFPNDISDMAVQIFLAEGQFQLMKTDIAQAPLLFLLTVVLTRMCLTPIINAGIYYSIHRDETKQIKPFISGVKRLGLPFFIIYCAQVLCIATPLYWLVPYVQKLILSLQGIDKLWFPALPLFIGYWAYVYIIKLCFMYIQFGKTTQLTLPQAFATFIRRLIPILAVSCMLLIISGALALVSLSLTLLWAGLFAVILHHMYYLTRTFMNIWEISAQFEIWKSAHLN